jgi:hypothetical protein
VARQEVRSCFTSIGNFVFFETGVPHANFAASLLKQGVQIGARISTF